MVFRGEHCIPEKLKVKSVKMLAILHLQSYECINYKLKLRSILKVSFRNKNIVNGMVNKTVLAPEATRLRLKMLFLLLML